MRRGWRGLCSGSITIFWKYLYPSNFGVLTHISSFSCYLKYLLCLFHAILHFFHVLVIIKGLIFVFLKFCYDSNFVGTQIWEPLLLALMFFLEILEMGRMADNFWLADFVFSNFVSYDKISTMPIFRIRDRSNKIMNHLNTIIDARSIQILTIKNAKLRFNW